METNIHLTGYDFAVLALVILFVGRGIWLGLLKQVTGLVSLYLGYLVASQYHDRLFPFLKGLSENPKVIFVVSIVILFVVTYVLAMLVGKGLAYVIEITISKWFDRSLGAILGLAQALIIVVLIHMILGSILAPESTILRDCQTCKGINMATDYARTLIRDADVRKSLMQQTPAISADAVRHFLEGSLEGEQQPNKPQQNETPDNQGSQDESQDQPLTPVE